MTRLEDLTQGAAVRGIVPDGMVTVIQAQWHGSNAVELTYKEASGRVGNRLLFRNQEPDLEVAEAGRPWSFDGDGALLRLVSEAYRIRLTYLFDPLLAVNTSLVDPLPHQITAVYEEMLLRQPLRFLLADDPGAGKTIMTGLLIKELLIRGDLHRCLIVWPGSLVEQWQDELTRKFGLDFDIVTRETVESSRSGNPFAEKNLVIARLDHLARNDEIQARLEQTDWDLVVCDEAHKMSASFFSGEVKETRRYKLGKLLGGITRHLLLLTATPHNGKEEDFQLFLALLDADRFEGRFRDGVHQVDASDLMRRMAKEQLLKFDGTPLFPERRAYTVNYTLSPEEAALYHPVTQYVTEEMNRADRLRLGGEGRRGNTVGFALTILQRRLASSPEAIYQSLRRRGERLEKRLREEEIGRRGAVASERISPSRLETDPLRGIREADVPYLTEEEVDELEDAPEGEVEQLEEQIADRVTVDKELIAVPGRPLAAFVCPDHPLLDATIDLVLERYRDLLKRGAILVDPHDEGTEVRALVYLEHAIQDGRVDKAGNRRIISKRLEFVELDESGRARSAGYAPYLDYRPIEPQEAEAVETRLHDSWLYSDLEGRAIDYAVEHLVPEHLQEVQRLREERIRLTRAAVTDRLTKEINYWDRRAADLEEQERAGKKPRLNSAMARRRADELTNRLQIRLAGLEQERQVSVLPPVVIGGALVVPIGLLPERAEAGLTGPEYGADAAQRALVEQVAMEAVMAAERRLGRIPTDVSKNKEGYDIESRVPGEGRLILTEVKGRKEGAETVTITRNEVLTALNKPDDYVLALVEVDGAAYEPRYIGRYPFREPGFAEVSVNLNLRDVLALGEAPS